MSHADAILREFPDIDPDTAETLHDYCERDKALRDLISILRKAPPEQVATAAAILEQQVLSNDLDNLAEALTLELDEAEYFGQWDRYDGFTPTRHAAIAAAVATLDHRDRQSVEDGLDALEPALRQIDAMKLKPEISDWPSFLKLRQDWQHHVLDREYDANTQRLLSGKQPLRRWNCLIDARTFNDIVVVPILTQHEFATEAAKVDPEVYPDFINKCIGNTARPFVVYHEPTGDAIAICVLQRRKGQWRRVRPTPFQADVGLIDLLDRFAKTYHQISQAAGKNAHQIASIDLDEEPDNQRDYRCIRCHPEPDTPPVGYHNTPARCDKCREHYQQLAHQPNQDFAAKQKCASCTQPPAPYIATAGSNTHRICVVCELIGREFTIYHHSRRKALQIQRCHRCHQPHTRGLHQTFCTDCAPIERRFGVARRTIVT